MIYHPGPEWGGGAARDGGFAQWYITSEAAAAPESHCYQRSDGETSCSWLLEAEELRAVEIALILLLLVCKWEKNWGSLS